MFARASIHLNSPRLLALLGLLLIGVPAAAARAESAPAHFTVKLPADARLTIDGVHCTLTSDTRSFATPPVEAGHEYFYTLRAEVVRDGRSRSQSKKVYFRAGESVRVEFGDLGTEPTVHTTKPTPAGAEGFTLSADEKAILELTNQERAKQNLAPLRANEKLFRAARSHSTNMARQDRLDHVLDGKDPGVRLQEVGYQHGGWGENVAMGQRTPAEAIATWMQSPGHRGNILNSGYQEIGIGIAASAGGGLYYTQVFGTRPGR
jgi:uncharacterized protein (TIGR03000 family)